jgi:ABC-type glycerol-3-phosphate transport system substrate-binding protein
VLEKAGVIQAPGTFAEFERTAVAVNSPPDRYGVGIMGKQGSGLYTSLASWLYSAGGRLVDFKTGEIFINDSRAVTALQFMADLVVKHKVTPPEVMTWEYDEIIAGGQRDRYVMAQTFAPYGTLINDPALSKTAGRWAWSVVPGHTDKAQSRTWIDGHFLAVPKYAKHPDWSLEFIRMACSKEWMLRSMERGNAPPRGSVLRDPAMVSKIGWPPSPPPRSKPASPPPRILPGTRWSCRCAPACRRRCWDRRPPSRRWTPSPRTGSAACGVRGSGDDRAGALAEPLFGVIRYFSPVACLP